MTNRPNTEDLLAKMADTRMTADEKASVWHGAVGRLGGRVRRPVRSPFNMNTHTKYFIRIGVIVALIASLTGTAFASNSAKPGDALFGIDRALEQVQLSLASDDRAAEIRLRHAEERLQEIQAMIAEARAAEQAGQSGTDTASSTDAGTATNTDNGTASSTATTTPSRSDDSDKWAKRISVGATLVIKDANAIFEGQYDGDAEAAIQAILDQLATQLGDDGYSELEIEVKQKSNGDTKLKIKAENERGEYEYESEHEDEDDDKSWKENATASTSARYDDDSDDDDKDRYESRKQDDDDDDRYEDNRERRGDRDDDDDDEDDDHRGYQPPVTTPSSTTSGSANTATTFTMAEVATHNSVTSCYAVVGGVVYDLTSWISQHPGGSSAIKNMCGIDGTAAFSQQHGSQGSAANALASFKIGVLQ